MRTADPLYTDDIEALEALIEDERWEQSLDAPGVLLHDCHATVAAALEGGLPGTLCVLFTNDNTVQALNRQFRAQDKPTNVLSFPGNNEAGQLGDVALAFETCLREASDNGVPLRHHAAHLIIHGLLHLAGYDHIDDDEAREMEALETELLARLNIADPYQADPYQADPYQDGE